MGCAASKKDEEDDVVLLCKERKSLIKLAVERRLFVARHSSPSSPIFITFPSSASETTETIARPTYHSAAFLDSSKVEREKQEQEEEWGNQEAKEEQEEEWGNQEAKEDEDEEEGEGEGEGDEKEFEDAEEREVVCEHFCGEMATPMAGVHKNFGWDFFDLFDGMRTQVTSGFSQSSDEDLRGLREEEGIPELEEDGEREISERKAVDVNNGEVGVVESVTEGGDVNESQEEHNSFRMIDTAPDGRELLEALKGVEDHFIRAYDSGLDVSRMLEANRVPMLSGLKEIKESSNKLIRSITWNRSTSSQSSSCKSLLSCSSKSSSTWTEFKNDLFDDYGGMESGSHSLTLGRLYAWEKKLYEEVKAGDLTRKLYEQKCSRLRNLDARGDDGLYSGDKTRAEVKDLHARILVAIRSAESISQRIQKLRDEELHPQLVELIHSLMRNWKIMLESHETQNRIVYEVKSFNCPTYGKFCNDSHRLSTLQLEAEVQNWRACFTAYVSSQKSYIEALNGWLSKFISPEVGFYSRGRSSTSVPPHIISGPPLLVICHDWLAWLEKLPEKSVTSSMKRLGKDIRALWLKQGEEQQQKRKVDGLAKVLDRKVMALQRAESRILESKIHEQESEVNVPSRIAYLTERKAMLDMFRKRLDAEKAKHHTSMQDTQCTTVNGFRTGFSSVFESLAEFFKASEKMYADLLTFSKNA
ncbi:hypothetical protein FH972_007026 [Carpinus fangiana]|uniref:DUF632 domain-containing protein n=1 Tax=Carpinus fangiana TaxID=176857 RepID=A0A5N6QVW9_9ROSI|nr:hypothetical protein FH972_007026 [Carpinus fangiana]